MFTIGLYSITNHYTVYALRAQVVEGRGGGEQEPFVYIVPRRPYAICVISLEKLSLHIIIHILWSDSRTFMFWITCFQKYVNQGAGPG